MKSSLSIGWTVARFTFFDSVTSGTVSAAFRLTATERGWWDECCGDSQACNQLAVDPAAVVYPKDEHPEMLECPDLHIAETGQTRE